MLGESTSGGLNLRDYKFSIVSDAIHQSVPEEYVLKKKIVEHPTLAYFAILILCLAASPLQVEKEGGR